LDIQPTLTTSLPPTPPGWDWSRKGHLTRRYGALRLTIVENKRRPGEWTVALTSGAGAHFWSPPFEEADEARYAAEVFGAEMIGSRHE
jgi:hypothetical protein